MSERVVTGVVFNVIAVRDIQGNTAAVVCEEMGDCVQVCGMCGVDGEQVHFESDAHHLEEWCGRHGLAYRREEADYEIEV